MAIDTEDEVLQDFLVEAGEILELLGEQLVDLEESGGDADLLNAVFRGFHTIKGGAGFLGLNPLVELCHRAEDVFNLLRNGERAVNAQLMDVILPVVDQLNDMFDNIRSGVDPDEADPQLLAALDAILANEPVSEAAAAAAVDEPAVSQEGDQTDADFEAMLNASASQPETANAAPASDEITDDEFEALLDELHGKGKHGGKPAVEPAAPANVAKPASDEITDDEFEALLDELHGKGKHSGVPANAQAAATPAPVAAAGGSGDDNITDDEFEALLDELHGKGSGPSKKPATASGKAAAEQKPQPAAKPKAEVTELKPKTADAAKTAKKPARETAAQAEPTVRVDTRRLDDIMNLVGELVLVRNRLSTLQQTVGDESVTTAVGNLDIVTADLQTAVMKTRMQPIKKVFGRFPRVVRDLARSLKKDIKLVMEGEETDLDKNLVEALSDPLVHLVRNAVDHGIEMPDDREAAGKSRQGTVLLKASQEGDHIELTIADDGKGMDPNVLRGKAVEKGIMDEDAAARLSDHDAYNLIFAPGFSTKEEISDISGRGVGMDVVKTRIVQLNGSVEIDSQFGEGSKLLIKVPLTLAIMPTLMVVLGTQTFALPLVNVCEIFDLDLTKTNIVDGQQVIVVRDKPLPLYYLSEWLVDGATRDMAPEHAHVVVVALGNQRVGFVVDELIGQEEVVIKPLGEMLQGTDGLAGATITGDGRIALILDVAGLLKAYARRI